MLEADWFGMMQEFQCPDGNSEAASTGIASELLRVSRLTVAVPAGDDERKVLDDVSFTVARGEVLGVLGESGAGKSTLALALLGILPATFRYLGGSVELAGRSLLALSERDWRSIRGRAISIVYQDSSTLNPVLRVEAQVVEVIRAHQDWKPAQCIEEARAALDAVGLSEPRLRAAYPHQLSGGQRQRVAIAQALVCKPDLIIADEPTASLDATTALGILSLLHDVRDRQRTAMMLISHQPEVLISLADRVAVLYAGQLIEEGRTADLFTSPLHPYTRELLRCRQPEAGKGKAKPRWPFIPGTPLPQGTTGCVFENRCLDRMEICRCRVPKITAPVASRSVRCFAYEGEGA